MARINVPNLTTNATAETRLPPRARDVITLGKGRFESFSDGVFAIAITLLILEVRLPSSITSTSTNGDQARALIGIWPQYLVYAVSFATVGIMWFNHHALCDHARTITYRIIIANLVLLGVISFLPFTTEVFAQLGLTPAAVVFYGLTMTATSFGYLGLQRAMMAAHPGSSREFTAWNVAGATFYPLATLGGYFVPLLGVLLIAALALFYALPNNIRMAQFRPPSKS